MRTNSLLKAGTGRVDITPMLGTIMGGYRAREEGARGVHDRLFATALALGEEEQEVAIVSCDLLLLNDDIISASRKLIQEKTGLSTERVLICTTHTHSGPDTFGLLQNEAIERYLKTLPPKIASCVENAHATMKLARLGVGSGKVKEIAFNRRLVMADGSVRQNTENICPQDVVRNGPVDEQLGIIKIVDREDSPIATFINFTLHPAVVGEKNLLFSADYPGYLNKIVEKDVGGMSLFLNGAFGNINHISQPGRWIDTFEEAERIGSILAESALKIWEGMDLGNGEEIAVKVKEIELPLRKLAYFSLGEAREDIKEKEKTLSEEQSWSAKRELYFAKENLFLLERGLKREKIEIQLMRIGRVVLVAIPFEIFVEFGLQIKQESPFEHTFIVGLANGYHGYIPTREAFSQGGYEVRVCLGSRFVPEAGEIVSQTILEMLRDNFC